MKRVSVWIHKKFSKVSIIINPKYPDHQQFDVEKCDKWKEFYPDAEENIPCQSMLPRPKEKKSGSVPRNRTNRTPASAEFAGAVRRP